MNTKELRIGNFVYISGMTKFPMEVVGLGSDWVYLDFEDNEGDVWEGDLEEMEGIPISEEILKGCGFVNTILKEECGIENSGDFWRRPHDMINFLWFKDGVCTVIDPLLDMSKDNFYFKVVSKPIKYVHELQNLMKSMFGVELEISL